MATVTGFSNSFTQGEICDDAWERVDIQPIEKGCELGENLIIRVAGPLGKRRGFWRLGDGTAGPSVRSYIVPFRRSIDDALMLELVDGHAWVWSADGSRLMDGMTQVNFSTGVAAAHLPFLRYRQIADVVYLRFSDGFTPFTFERHSNTDWEAHAESFTNGPWLNENTTLTSTIEVTGTDVVDANGDTGAGAILAGEDVTLVANVDLFDPAMVGGFFRLRAGDGSSSARGWAPGTLAPLGWFCLSNGRVYRSDMVASNKDNVATPPVQSTGDQSDGGNMWTYLHDGAGIVRITTVTDSMNATGHVIATLPFKSGTATSYFAEVAYSAFRGWPRMWPALREERMVEGSTLQLKDYLDLTETAGFGPTFESFHPGLGTGQVLDTDAIRRRIGDDGAELIWAQVATYLVIGTPDGVHLVAGSVLDEPLSPAAVTIKPLSFYGAADVYPARAHKGLLYVATGNETLRELAIDTQQGASGDDLTVLAGHIGARLFEQVVWVKQPDNVAWTRLGDAGLAAMTYHQEQNVRGWTSQRLPGGWTVEDTAVLPGPGRKETLWLVVSRVKAGVTQRQIWMQSQVSDALFIDGAEFYEGAPVTTVSGLGHYEGETVAILADGVQLNDQVVSGGEVTVSPAASEIQVGLSYAIRFKSLKLDPEGAGHSLNTRKRVVGVTASLKSALCRIGIDGQGPGELFSTRGPNDVPGAVARRAIKNCNIAADTSRDPRLVIEDSTAYDFVLYSLKPTVETNG